MSETSVPDNDCWVFRCPECGREWVDPPAPVEQCYRDHDRVDVEIVNRPEVDG